MNSFTIGYRSYIVYIGGAEQTFLSAEIKYLKIQIETRIEHGLYLNKRIRARQIK